MIKFMFQQPNKLEKMTRNVQEIILLLFSITILSNCDEWMCYRMVPEGTWNRTTDACYREIENGTIQRWVPTPSKPQSSQAFYEMCDAHQSVPVFDRKKLGQDIMLISAIFSNPGNSTYEKVNLYGNAHQFFGFSSVEDYFKVDSKTSKTIIGCPVYKSPKLMKDTWDCGVNGVITEDLPEALISTQIQAGCGYTNGIGMFEGEGEKTFRLENENIYTETLITSLLHMFCVYETFLSDVYIIGTDGEEGCIRKIRKISGRLFILNVKSEIEFNFEKLEEIGENLQYGKRPIIQVVGNKIPAISFPNLKKIHCEFSTDVCVVYANNNISKFAGVNYERVPKSDGASYVGQAQILPPPREVIVIVVHENSHTKELLIGFAVILILVITICSFWMGVKDNDYPENFKYKFF